ncbi:MAG: hypothetical protein RML36_16780 [Anaerolineae bacterium]|nr:hypothetical protein [Anaerolineae bacterium]MDW8101130.1 hypothetical protein [Anaerolineae bacterium]
MRRIVYYRSKVMSLLLILFTMLAAPGMIPAAAAGRSFDGTEVSPSQHNRQARRAALGNDMANNPLHGSTAAAPRYTVTDLGSLGGGTTVARKINDLGQVVGWATTPEGPSHAFLWRDGTLTDLNPANAYSSGALDINDAGHVVGSLQITGLPTKGFVWRNGALQVLNSGDYFAVASAINNSGLVVGTSPRPDCDVCWWYGVAVLWLGGQMRMLGITDESRATDVNDGGQVVGYILYDDRETEAFLWRAGQDGAGQTTLLGALGGQWSRANAINEAGQVVGTAQLPNGVLHAFLWENGVMLDLGTQADLASEAHDINDLGQAVGYERSGNTYRAVLWDDLQMWDLNSLIPAGSGWELRIAYGINNRGEIVGEGRRNGQTRAFLLRPLPAITDLRAEPGVLPGQVDLRWTAPERAGSAPATAYDICYSRSPIDETTWHAATQAQGEPAPSAPGEEDAYTTAQLGTGVRWYFAVKVRYRDGSWSPLSNVPSLLDLGFRPAPDGYAFANFSGSLDTDLTYDDMIRMFDSQTAVCYNATGPCQPRETAAAWRVQALRTASAGRCLGFSTTALRFFKGIDDLAAFQRGATNVYDLTRPNLRGSLTFYQIRQYNMPWSGYRNAQLARPPSAHLAELRDALSGSASDPVTVSVFGTVRGGFTGHAVVPYAVEERQDDWQVWLYDNNSPGMSATMLITPTAESWLYHDLTGSLRLSGNAGTKSLAVTRISEMAKPSVCPYCPPPAAPNAPAAGSAASETTAAGEAQVWLTDAGRLLIRDSQGRRIGHVGDDLVNEIPGASANLIPGGLDIPTEPIYTLPLTETYEITLEGAGVAGVKPASLVQFGPGYATGAEAIPVSGSTLDRVVIAGDGRRVTYRANAAKQVDLLLAADESSSRGYRLELQGVDLAAGAAVAAEIDAATGRLVYRHHGAGAGQYAVSVRRSDATGQRRFFHGGVAVAAGDVHRLDVAGWDGNGALRLEIDRGGDGTVDATVMLENRLGRVFLPLVLRR